MIYDDMASLIDLQVYHACYQFVLTELFVEMLLVLVFICNAV